MSEELHQTGMCSGCGMAADVFRMGDFVMNVPCAKCRERARSETAAEQKAQQHRTLAESWQRLCLARFRDFDPEHPDVDQVALFSILPWKPTEEKGIGLLSGKSGAVKTRMIWRLLRDLHFEGVRFQHIHACELADLYPRNPAQSEAVERRLKQLKKAPLLFIDDLGKERSWKDSDAIPERVYSLLDYRYTQCLPLLWTSNLTERALTDWYGERGPHIVRRLRDMTVWVEVVKGRKKMRASSLPLPVQPRKFASG